LESEATAKMFHVKHLCRRFALQSRL